MKGLYASAMMAAFSTAITSSGAKPSICSAVTLRPFAEEIGAGAPSVTSTGVDPSGAAAGSSPENILPRFAKKSPIAVR